MAFSLKDDFKTVEELRDAPEALLRQVEQTRQPVVVTMKGKPAGVLLGIEQYEWMVHLLELGRALAKGEEDVRAGRVRPAEEFFKELLGKTKRAKKASG